LNTLCHIKNKLSLATVHNFESRISSVYQIFEDYVINNEFLSFKFNLLINAEGNTNQLFELAGVLFDWDQNKITFWIEDKIQIITSTLISNYRCINSPLIMELRDNVVNSGLGIIPKPILPIYHLIKL
jgi:hypothetical protein